MLRKILAVLLWMALTPAFAMTGERAKFREISKGVYVYIGKFNEANALAIVTSEGVILVDTGHSPPETRNLASEISKVTTQLIRYVIVTQNHGDHLGGAPFFIPGATLIVHQKVAKALVDMKPYQVKSWRSRFPERLQALSGATPLSQVISFPDRLIIELGGQRIETFHVPDEFNDGDIGVWLPASGILHAGFVGYKDRHPDLRPDFSHGTTLGMLKQLDTMIALKPTTVVPGHGPLATSRDLLTEVEYVLAARAKVQAMVNNGHTLKEIRDTFSMNEYAGWDLPDHFPIIAETIHRELLGLGPQRAALEDISISAKIDEITELGRFLNVTADDGTRIKLRISNETVVEGIASRAMLKAGMRLKGLYQKPEGLVPPLGFLLMEVTAIP